MVEKSNDGVMPYLVIIGI